MPKPVLLTEDEFRAAAKGNSVPAEAALRKSFVTEVKAPADDGRVITFAISTGAVDRMGDTIAVDGWQLGNYRANPVVLWAHDSDELPVAKCRRIWIEADKLMAEADFTPTPTAWPEFNETVFQFLKHGLLNATSVGFAPMRYAFSEDDGRTFGIDFLEQELLEFSVVPVPANPECLQQAKSLGINIEPVAKWCEGVLRAQGLAVLPQARFDAISALPEEFRASAKKVPASVKGARGLWLRCANAAEKALKGDSADTITDADDPPAPPVQPADQDDKTAPLTPRLDMARRRLALLRV